MGGKEKSEEEKLDIKRKQVFNLFAKGQIFRGVGRFNSHGDADNRGQKFMRQLTAKYPQRGMDMPDTYSCKK